MQLGYGYVASIGFKDQICLLGMASSFIASLFVWMLFVFMFQSKDSNAQVRSKRLDSVY